MSLVEKKKKTSKKKTALVEKTPDQAKIEELESLPNIPFHIPSENERIYIKETAEDIIKSNLFGEKNIAIAKLKVHACLHLKIDPILFYDHIQVIPFAGKNKVTQSAHLMVYLVLRSFPNAILKQGWVGIGDKLQFNMLVKHPARKPTPFSFTLQEGFTAGYHHKNKNWEKVPKDMVRSRCITRMVRTEFPDVLGGIIYSPEDFDQICEVEDEE